MAIAKNKVSGLIHTDRQKLQKNLTASRRGEAPNVVIPNLNGASFRGFGFVLYKYLIYLYIEMNAA
jgi:hypothetical protein